MEEGIFEDGNIEVSIIPPLFRFRFSVGTGRGESGLTLRSVGILTHFLAGNRETLLLLCYMELDT